MKEKLANNWGLKLISVGLAFFLWMVVLNADNPYETKTLTIHNIEYRNEDVVLTSDQTYKVEDLDSKGVEISVKVRRKESGKVRSADFRAIVDLSQIGPFGSVEVKVEWLGSDQYELRAEDITWKTKSVNVTLEEIMKRDYPVRLHISGQPKDSYIVGDYMTDPVRVTIMAPKSIQEQIHSVGIEVNVAGMNADVEGTATLKLYDMTGAELKINTSTLEDYEFSISTKEIRYKVPLLKIKEVILRTNGYVGTVAEGYRYTGMEGANQTAYIAGYRNVLAEVDAIDIPAEALDLEGATSNKEIKINLTQYVPEGVTVEGNTIVTIVMMVEPLVKQTREILPGKIRMVGMQEGLEYSIQDSISIVIEGLQEDLNTLTNEMLDAWIEVQDLKPGTSEVEVHLKVDNAFTLLRTDVAKVLVKEIPESTEESTEESKEEETTKAEDPTQESTSASDSTEDVEVGGKPEPEETQPETPEAEGTGGTE